MFIPTSVVVFITISSAWKLKFFVGYCFELCTCAHFFETVFGGLGLEGAGLGLGLEGAGLGLCLGLETTGLGLETLVLTTRLLITDSGMMHAS